MHEHVFVLQPEALQNCTATSWAVRATGTRSSASPTRSRSGRRPGCGHPDDRRPYHRVSAATSPCIHRVNAEVDLNIVVATGVYAFLELPNFFGYRSPDAIAEFFIREIREGIDDTGVKAAFLEVRGRAARLIGDVPRILAAVAIAAIVKTRAPVMVAYERRRENGPAGA